MNSVARGKAGFTLVELLVTVSILALLVAMAVPTLRRARHKASATLCGQGLHQLGYALNAYASDHDFALPEGETRAGRLPSASAEALRRLLDGRIELLYCRTYPYRSKYLGAWRTAIAEGHASHGPRIGYVYLAGSIFDGWDVPNKELPADFRGARRIESVGNGLSGCSHAAWAADFAMCSTASEPQRNLPRNWLLVSHPPQRVRQPAGREDYRLPDGANVLFEDGHVTFRPFHRLRPRLMHSQSVLFW